MTRPEKKYKYAVIAADVVIFTLLKDKLNVLLIKMKKKPYRDNFWAAPGGLVRPKESVKDAAIRHLSQKTGVKNVYLEQLYTFGEVDRDPFGRVVSVAYFALIPKSNTRLKTTQEYGDVQWFSLNSLPKLAYDHKKIIAMAYLRLKSKLSYSNIVCGLLPKEFTLSQLQKTYEVILKKKLDKRNFRKKILLLNLLKKTKKILRGGAHRPAALYKFISQSPKYISVL